MTDNSFTEIAGNPQLMLWVKCIPYPYWPAKVVSINGEDKTEIEVNFFGENSSAIVEPKDCFLYSREKPSTSVKKHRTALTKSIKEADLYIRNVIAKFGAFNYAEKKTPFNPANIDQHLSDMISPMSHQSNTTAKSVQKRVHAESDERLSPKQKKPSNKTPNKREDNTSDHQVNRNKRLKSHHHADEDETNKQTSSNGVEPILVEDTVEVEESRNDDVSDEAPVLVVNTVVTGQPVVEESSNDDEAILVANTMVTTQSEVKEISSDEEDCVIQLIQAHNKSNMIGMCSSAADSIQRISMPSTLNSNHFYTDGCSCYPSAMNAARFTTTDLQICSLRDQIDTLKTSNELFCNEVKEIERELKLIRETRTKMEIERNRFLNEIRVMQLCAYCGEAQLKCCPNIRYCQNPCQKTHRNHHMETCQQNNPVRAKIEDETN